MTTITIRASNCVTALEMVQKRLGDDALILSTQTVDGVFEIVATNDPEQVPEPRADRPNQTHRVDILVKDEVIVDLAPVPECVGAVPHSEEAAPVSEGFGTILARRRVLRASRLIMFGPAGGGKCLAAVQLALLRLAETPDEAVEFFFCGSGSWSDGAVLAQKSHMLGMTTEFIPAETIPAPKSGTCQIVVVSGRCPDGPDQLGRLLDKGDGVLVLPTGLRADHIRRTLERWKHETVGVILSLSDFIPPSPQDADALSAVGLSTLWTSAPDLLVAGLQPPVTQLPPTMQYPLEEAVPRPAHPVFRHSKPLVELPI